MSDTMDKAVGDGIGAESASWSFGGETCKSFDAHVEKSVPFYHEGHELILGLSDFFLPEGGRALEVGCSTGLLISRLADRHMGREVEFVGVDCEQQMIEYAKKNRSHENVSYHVDRIENVDLGMFDLVVGYYTMQFIHPRIRQEVFNRIYQSLNWGGALLLFEKVRAPDARFQDISTQIYHDLKLARGYSQAQVMNKERSLRGVLEPFSTQGNNDLLSRAGFVDVMSIFKYVSFEGFLAIK